MEGLDDARIEDFTRRAGIAKGTFYLHFPSKEAIVQEVTRDAFAELGARCRMAASSGQEQDARTAALVAAHLDFYSERPGRMRILHQARGLLKFSRPEWQPLQAALDAHLALLAELLALRATSTRQDDAARLLFGAVSGAASVFTAATSREGVASTDAATSARLVAPLTQMILDFIIQRSRRSRPGRS